jgi:deazaflavin-dependent oxidoreductase (nitroreductase family)
MSETTIAAPPRKIPALARAAMQFQVFLLRRNWIGPMGQALMVITTTGRKTGQQFSTPIGYLRDGAEVIALSVGGRSHWYQNLLRQPNVILNIQGRDYAAQAQAVTEPHERRRIFELYQREQAQLFTRLFGVPVDAPAPQLEHALATRHFVRFRLNTP